MSVLGRGEHARPHDSPLAARRESPHTPFFAGEESNADVVVVLLLALLQWSCPEVCGVAASASGIRCIEPGPPFRAFSCLIKHVAGRGKICSAPAYPQRQAGVRTVQTADCAVQILYLRRRYGHDVAGCPTHGSGRPRSPLATEGGRPENHPFFLVELFVFSSRSWNRIVPCSHRRVARLLLRKLCVVAWMLCVTLVS